MEREKKEKYWDYEYKLNGSIVFIQTTYKCLLVDVHMSTSIHYHSMYVRLWSIRRQIFRLISLFLNHVNTVLLHTGVCFIGKSWKSSGRRKKHKLRWSKSNFSFLIDRSFYPLKIVIILIGLIKSDRSKEMLLSMILSTNILSARSVEPCLCLPD